MSLTNDIVIAIYLAAKMNLKSCSIEEWQWPSHPESRRHSVLADVKKVLDALAMLCVSKPRMQVCAIGLRVTASEVELVVAENEKIAPATIKHLENMWSSLQKLSARFERYHAPLRTSASPSLPLVESLDPETRALFTNFRHRALKFGGVKLGKRLSKHFGSFNKMEVARDHFFFRTWLTVVFLTYMIGGGKTPIGDDWTEVAFFLDGLKYEMDQFDVDYPEKLKSITPGSFDVSKYLSKITRVFRNVHVLLQAANVPRLRGLFRDKKLVITALEPISELYEMPSSATAWKEAIERVLEERNLNRYYLEDELRLNKIAIKDAKRLAHEHQEEAFASYTATPANVVHPECRIIQHTFGPNAPRIYSYIGISKSSCCHGCWEYMRAVNTVHGTNLQTKDLPEPQQRKWSYPWAFAATTIRLSQRVAAVMYENVARQIGRFYPGFRAVSRDLPLANDWELDPEDDHTEFEDNIIELLTKFLEEGGKD